MKTINCLLHFLSVTNLPIVSEFEGFYDYYRYAVTRMTCISYQAEPLFPKLIIPKKKPDANGEMHGVFREFRICAFCGLSGASCAGHVNDCAEFTKIAVYAADVEIDHYSVSNNHNACSSFSVRSLL
jgi:hypothetical protein